MEVVSGIVRNDKVTTYTRCSLTNPPPPFANAVVWQLLSEYSTFDIVGVSPPSQIGDDGQRGESKTLNVPLSCVTSFLGHKKDKEGALKIFSRRGASKMAT